MNERKLLFRSPVTLLFLGAVPALGASADLRGALGMSAAVLGVLLLSALILGLLRKLIPAEAKLPAAVLVVAGCASAAQDAVDFGLGKGLCSALASGLIFAAFVLALALIRELFGAASLAGNPVEALAAYKIPLLTKVSGGLVVYAILLAVVNAVCPAQDGAGELSRAAAGLGEEKEAQA